MSIRIGVASIDNSRVDQHFGSARYWQIYDIGTESAFVETRKTKATCGGHCEGGFAEQLNVLADCDALFVLKIGEGAARVMIEKGKRVFEAAGPVEDLIDEIAAQGLLTDIVREA